MANQLKNNTRPMQDALISVNGLTRWYGTRRAVHELAFEVRRGEVLGFLGPNGAGKSTTMQMITGNLAPSAGAVRIAGFDLFDHPREAKALLGYLPEQPPIYRDLTVDEYLRYCARLHGLARGSVNGAVDGAKARCGLTEVGRRLIGNLSKGYQQRVGIAQAILHNPMVVILDEPTVGLDPIQIREIRQLIRELGSEHSVVLSTHILPEVQGTCDRVQIIHRGELVLSDTIDGIGRRIRGSALTVAFRRPPDTAALAAIPGVQAAEPLGEGRWHLIHDPEQDPTDPLVATAVAEDWGVFELIPERQSLEEIFVELTRGDGAEAAA